MHINLGLLTPQGTGQANKSELNTGHHECGFSWLFWIVPGKCQESTFNRLRPLSFCSFLIHHPSIRRFSLATDSVVNNLQKEKKLVVLQEIPQF